MKRKTCVTCGQQSPEASSEHTLISSVFGWRIIRHTDEKGAWIFEWRCPPCWRDYKKTIQREQGLEASPESVRPELVSYPEFTRPPLASQPETEDDQRPSGPPTTRKPK